MTKRYFYKGKLVEFESVISYNPSKAIVRVLIDYSNSEPNIPFEELYVTKEELEDPINEVFTIGDAVVSTLGGYNADKPLKGTITAFEYSTNRAIVVSNKIDNYNNYRTRYAYKAHEIKEDLSDKYYTFQKGQYYRINDNVNVMAIRQVLDEELLMFVTKNGNIIHRDIAPWADKTGLALNNGIKSAVKIDRW